MLKFWMQLKNPLVSCFIPVLSRKTCSFVLHLVIIWIIICMRCPLVCCIFRPWELNKMQHWHNPFFSNTNVSNQSLKTLSCLFAFCIVNINNNLFCPELFVVQNCFLLMLLLIRTPKNTWLKTDFLAVVLSKTIRMNSESNFN